MDISVVIPVLNEEENLKSLHSRLSKVLSSLKTDKNVCPTYEIIFVDDGSTDRSFQILKELAKEDPHIQAIRLTRNFGQHPAILAGFERSQGEIIVTLDADLQNPPEEIPKLLKKMEEGYDVVSGWRRKRRDSFIRQLISSLLNRFTSNLIGAFSRTPLHDYGSMLRAYRRSVVERILQHGGRSFYLPTLVASFGERICEVEVEHRERRGGVSKYGPSGMFRLYFDLIAGETLYPFRFFLLLGILLILSGFGLGIFIFLRMVLTKPETQGIFFPFSSFFLVIFGILLVAIGVLGEYLGRIYKEVGKRPSYLAQEVVGASRLGGTMPMRIAFFGYGEIGYSALEYLVGAIHELPLQFSCVVTHMDDPNEKIWFKSVRDLALKNLIPVYIPEDVNQKKFIEILKDIHPDLILSVQFRQILSEEILKIPPLGGVNLHPSILPKYRGRVPINWAIIQGEKKTGVTLHYMSEKPDTGDIISQREVSIGDEDTAYTLYQKIIPPALAILQEYLPLIQEKKAPKIPQKEEEATQFGRRRPEDGKILWEKSSLEIHNLVRGVTHPFPGAFTHWDGKKLIIWKARGIEEGALAGKRFLSFSTGPGSILGVFDSGILVACGKGALLIERAELDGDLEVRGKVLAERFGIRVSSKFS